MLDRVGNFSDIIESGAQSLLNGRFFMHEGVTYRLASPSEGSSSIYAYIGDFIVGQTYTSNRGIHAGLVVHGDANRNKGIGKMLFYLKAELDGGVLGYEWSKRCSRMLFLIRRGYVPTGIVLDTSRLDTDFPLGEGDFDELAHNLGAYIGDTTKENLFRVYRLRYDPVASSKFLQQFGLEKSSIGVPEKVFKILS